MHSDAPGSVPQPPKSSPASNPSGADRWQQPVFYFFLAIWVAVLAVTFLMSPSSAVWTWGQILLVAAAAATIAVSQARRLAPTNVCMISLLIAAIAVLTLVIRPGEGREASANPDWNDPLQWAVPFLWMVATLVSRSTAKTILRPWRQIPGYTYVWISLAALLTLILALGFDPVGFRSRTSWTNSASGGPNTRLVWFYVLIALIIQLFISPWLVNKKLMKPSLESHSLVLWILLATAWLMAADQWDQTGIWIVSGAVVAVALLAFRGLYLGKKEPGNISPALTPNKPTYPALYGTERPTFLTFGTTAHKLIGASDCPNRR